MGAKSQGGRNSQELLQRLGRYPRAVPEAPRSDHLGSRPPGLASTMPMLSQHLAALRLSPDLTSFSGISCNQRKSRLVLLRNTSPCPAGGRLSIVHAGEGSFLILFIKDYPMSAT